LTTAGRPFLGRPALLHVGLLLFCFHVEFGHILEVNSFVVCDISAGDTNTFSDDDTGVTETVNVNYKHELNWAYHNEVLHMQQHHWLAAESVCMLNKQK